MEKEEKRKIEKEIFVIKKSENKIYVMNGCRTTG